MSIRDTISHSIIICLNSSLWRNEFNSTTSAPIISRVILVPHTLALAVRWYLRVIVQSTTNHDEPWNVVHARYILGKTAARRNTTSHCDGWNESDQAGPHNGRPVCIVADDRFSSRYPVGSSWITRRARNDELAASIDRTLVRKIVSHFRSFSSLCILQLLLSLLLRVILFHVDNDFLFILARFQIVFEGWRLAFLSLIRTSCYWSLR